MSLYTVHLRYQSSTVVGQCETKQDLLNTLSRMHGDCTVLINGQLKGSLAQAMQSIESQ